MELTDKEINQLKFDIQYYYRMPNEIICGDFNVINDNIPGADLIILNSIYGDKSKNVIHKCMNKMKLKGYLSILTNEYINTEMFDDYCQWYKLFKVQMNNETLYLYVITNDKLGLSKMNKLGNILDIHIINNNEELYSYIITYLTEENQLIYEPFANKCDAAYIAKKLNRQFISVDDDQSKAIYGLKRIMLFDN